MPDEIVTPKPAPVIEAPVEVVPDPASEGSIEVVTAPQEAESRRRALENTRIGPGAGSASVAAGEIPAISLREPTPEVELRPDVHTVNGVLVTRTSISRRSSVPADLTNKGGK